MPEKINQYYLDNGLKVILKKDEFSPVTSLFVWVNTGSAYENDKEKGLAHVHEHMIFKGTSQLQVGEVSRQIEAHGGEVNAFTSYDETVYYTTLSNDFAHVALSIFSECMHDALFDEGELKKELEVILEEIKMGEDSPNKVLWNMICANAFQDHPYGLPIIGTPKSVKSFARKDLQSFYNKWYQPKNIKLIVVGGGETGELKNKINQTFGSLGAKNVNTIKLNDDFNYSGLQVHIDHREVNECYFALSFRAEKTSDLKSPILDVLGIILGVGTSSVLNKRLKEELALVTSIYSYNFSARHGGAFVIGGTLLEKNIKDALRLIVHEIRKIINLDFDSDQLKRAKTELLTQNLYENETVQRQAQKIGYLESEAGSIKFEEDYLECVKHATPDVIQNVAKEFLHIDNLALNLIFPKNSKKQDADGFKSILNKAFDEKLQFSKNNFETFNIKNYLIEDVQYPEPTLLQLDCGINLIVLQNSKTPLISLRSVSFGGSRYETRSSNGKFNMLSELLTRGSSNYTKNEIAMNTEILAADIEGFSGKNSLGVKMVGPSANLKEVVPIFSDVVANPIFEDSEIEIVRNDMLSYLNRKKQSYESIVAEKFFELLFNKHPYSLNQFGTEESVSNIKRNDIVQTHEDFISKNNILLCAVGNFEVARLLEELNRNISFKNEEKKLPNVASCSLIDKDIVESIKLGDKQQSHTIVGTYAPSLDSENKFSFNVLDAVLSGMGGRLFMELREKKSLAYSVYSFFKANLDYGYFGIYIGCSPEKKMQSIDAINNELEKLIEKGITNEELERAKNYLIGRNDISLQRNASINARIAYAGLYGLSLNEPFDFSSKIKSISQDSINSVIEKYLKGKSKVTVSVDPS